MAFAFIFDTVSGGEWLVLLAVVLIVVGPKNLPAVARKTGSVLAQLRRAADEFKRQLMTMDSEIRSTVESTVSQPAAPVEIPDSSAAEPPPSGDGDDGGYDDPEYGDGYDGGPYDGYEDDGGDGDYGAAAGELEDRAETEGMSSGDDSAPHTDEAASVGS